MADTTIQRYDTLTQQGRAIRLIDNGDSSYSEQVAVAPVRLTEHTFTWAIGASESGEVDLGNEAIVTIYPADAVEATTAQLSLKRGRVAGSRKALRDVFNARKIISFTAGEPVEVPADWAKHNPFTSFVLETAAGVAVAQTAERVFIVVTRAV